MLSFREFCRINEEDGGGAPANNMGSGAIASPDIPLSTTTKKSRKQKTTVLKRTPPVVNEEDQNTFAGAKVFKVSPEVFHQCRVGKYPRHRWSKYVGSDETGEAIRTYGKSNPGAPIVVQHARTGEMMYLRHPGVYSWKKS